MMLTKEWFTVVNGAGVYVVYSNDRDDHSPWRGEMSRSVCFTNAIVYRASARWPRVDLSSLFTPFSLFRVWLLVASDGHIYLSV